MPPPTEPTLLSRYLLPPSSLSTIIPYSTFLSLLPSTLRSTATNNPKSDTAILLKRLYQDLQFQRDVDIDNVRQNIQRECARSEVVRGRLRREVREELGENVDADGHGGEKKTKKRKRGAENEHEEDEEDQLSIPSDDEERSTLSNPHPAPATGTTAASTTDPPQSDTTRNYDTLTNPLETHIDTLFSGPRGLAAPLPTSTHPTPTAQQKYHTTSTLLRSLQQSIASINAEIADLDNQSAKVLESMKETVGGMSDLRYGKFARLSAAGGEGSEEENGLEEQVTRALRELRQTAERNARKTKGVQ